MNTGDRDVIAEQVPANRRIITGRNNVFLFVGGTDQQPCEL